MLVAEVARLVRLATTHDPAPGDRDAVDPVPPMPTMPSPPAAVTAAASRPRATPPIGALTIGTRGPKLRDHGVDNIRRLLCRGNLVHHRDENHRVLESLQGMALARNRDMVAGLAVPRIITGG